jgi:hypothetical protein
MVRFLNMRLSPMPVTETIIRREDWEVRPRLTELRSDRDALLRVRTTAVGAAADATPFHPANAAGTLSYQHGTFGLRIEHVGTKGWQSDRTAGVEAISNTDIRVRFVFANVDVACDDEHEPRARSDKGAGAERLCAGNGLFDYLPRFADETDPTQEGWMTFFLMVAPDGAAELSRVMVKGGRFEKFLERLYLSDGSDLDTDAKLLDDDQTADQYDPKVARK